MTRYDLSSEPQAFMSAEAVSDALNKNGAKVLPITTIDGAIVKSGSYPTNEEFARLLGVSIDEISSAPGVSVNKCNCGSKGCC